MQSERRNDRNVDNNKFSLCDYIVYAKTVMGGKWVCKKVSISIMLIYVFSPVGHNIYTFILVTKKTVQVQQLQLLLLLLFTLCQSLEGPAPLLSIHLSTCPVQCIIITMKAPIGCKWTALGGEEYDNTKKHSFSFSCCCCCNMFCKKKPLRETFGAPC